MKVLVALIAMISSLCFGQQDPASILNEVDRAMQRLGMVGPDQDIQSYECVLRVFKMEGECEIWASPVPGKGLSHVSTVPICAVDRRPGPKLREGDGKTPEGFFEVNFKHGFASRQWFMWIDLDDPFKTGEVGVGSCFKTFIEYPTELDRFHTRLAGFSNPGGAIFAHGNCVTAGCVSFQNRNYLPVFSYARHAFIQRAKGSRGVQIHIFPFRFDQVKKDQRSELAKRNAKGLSPLMVTMLWENLEEGFWRFEKHPEFLSWGYRLGPLKMGETSSRVVALKRLLASHGQWQGNETPVFDSLLEKAVKDEQKQCGLRVDGIVGEQTMRKLDFLPPGYDFD